MIKLPNINLQEEVRDELEGIGKRLKREEHEISNLQCLNLIKKSSDTKQPQIKLQIESVNKVICPFCLNRINWDKLYTAINMHNEIIHYLNKQLAEIIMGKELSELEIKSELTEEEKEAVKRAKELLNPTKA